MDDPGNLFAEFFNACPFIHHHLEGGPKVLHRLRGDLRLLQIPLANPSHRQRQFPGNFPIQKLGLRQQIDCRRSPSREGHFHLS